MPASICTHFDTAARTPMPVLEQVAQELSSNPLIRTMLDAFPGGAVLIDENRQIVVANARAVAIFDVIAPVDLLGSRLGEALACVHVPSANGGCGTCRSCAECGAAHAIREAGATGVHAARDCRVTIAHNGMQASLDLRVHVTPMRVGSNALRLVAIEDIAAEKRRQALERIFFHDVLATGTALHGLAQLVAGGDENAARAARPALVRASGQLLQEIQAQRDLMLAESGELRVQREPLLVNDVLDMVHQQYCRLPIAAGRELVWQRSDAELRVATDKTQLVRCIGNLVRNALEAVSDGGQVVLSAHAAADGVLLQVANPGCIPATLQSQIFQRSFSTKALRGRGLGTYSARLIVQQYLGGRVSFVSSDEAGTVFSIWLPGE